MKCKTVRSVSNWRNTMVILPCNATLILFVCIRVRYGGFGNTQNEHTTLSIKL